MKLQKTNREKELIQKWNEFEKKNLISISDLEELKKAMWKVLLELDRMRKRVNKFVEEEK